MGIRIRIPERFTLMGREWRVERPDVVDPEDPDCIGRCSGRERLIEVTSRADGEGALEIFAHEIAHAGLWRAGLSPGLDERMAQAMEYVILDAIRALVEEG